MADWFGLNTKSQINLFEATLDQFAHGQIDLTSNFSFKWKLNEEGELASLFTEIMQS